jgi:SAM-dependent methyltransferase
MTPTAIDDVPSPIDLRLMADAREWEATAFAKRPARAEFFGEFVAAVAASERPMRRILELGSGPGFLAERILRALPDIDYVALDFSPAMHQLAAQRLGALGSRVRFVERSFKEPGWQNGLGVFDCVVTHQALHELRHKRHAPALHAQVRQLLAPGGCYLVCDHFVGEGGMQDNQLFMTEAEHCAALIEAGFVEVRPLLRKGGLVLHQAR